MRDEVPASRALAAVVVTALLILAAPAMDVVLGSRAPQASDDATEERGVSARAILAGDDPAMVLQNLEEVAESADAEIPDGFLREIGLPPHCRDVRVDASGQVVGCTVDGAAGTNVKGLELRMRERGGTSVPLGNEEGATFVKEGGDFTWVVVTCTQVGSVTSVVFRCNG